MDSKIFTYEEAQALVEQVREHTEIADERLKSLRAQLNELHPASSQAAKMSEWINTVINQWAEEILALGALPKGLWTVDFDSGEGFYYCWTLGEAELTHFHRYEEGFAGRKPLSHLTASGEPILLN